MHWLKCLGTDCHNKCNGSSQKPGSHIFKKGVQYFPWITAIHEKQYLIFFLSEKMVRVYFVLQVSINVRECVLQYHHTTVLGTYRWVAFREALKNIFFVTMSQRLWPPPLLLQKTIGLLWSKMEVKIFLLQTLIGRGTDSRQAVRAWTHPYPLKIKVSKSALNGLKMSLRLWIFCDMNLLHTPHPFCDICHKKWFF